MLTSTPSGTFSIINKAPNPGGPFGSMWLGLSKPHYGIHGTNNPASIGKNVSHGCIRMYNRDVNELARLVPIGTPVYIRP
jgi:lipoprotein-anchoring transpeptidase ErfK/SrfK